METKDVKGTVVQTVTKKDGHPIHCWMVTKDFEIKSWVIPEYEVIQDGDKKNYRFKNDFGIGEDSYTARGNSFDRLVYRKLFSFNPDESVAYENILNSVEETFETLKKDYENYSKLCENLRTTIKSGKPSVKVETKQEVVQSVETPATVNPEPVKKEEPKAPETPKVQTPPQSAIKVEMPKEDPTLGAVEV